MVAALADGLDGCRLRDLFPQARKRHRGRRHDRAASRRRSVAASWNLIDIRTAEFAGVFFMADAVTNEQGEFALPAWGPRGITMGNSGRIPRALDYAEPHLHLFKSGFRYRIVAGQNPAIERLRGARWL